MIVSYNGYAQVAQSFENNPILMTNQVKSPISYHVYPNPISDYLTIKINDKKKFQYVISNIIGKRILQGQVNKSINLDLTGLRKGIYVLNIYNNVNEKLASKKLVKK